MADDAKPATSQAITDLEQHLIKSQKRGLAFLLVGRTGVGKSSTINSLLGAQIAPVGEFAPTTAEVKAYFGRVNEVDFTVVDTPGLCDDLEEAGNDERYLLEIHAKSPALDCVWFVTQLDDTRVTSDEKRAIKMLSERFGADLWKHAVLVFTHAAAIGVDRYERVLSERTRLLRQEVARWTSQDLAEAIPTVAVDNTTPLTPDGQPWLGELFTTVVERIGDESTVPFLLAMAKSIAPDREARSGGSSAPRIALNEGQKERVSEKADSGVIAGGVMAGAAIGALVGGPVGGIIGGAIGAAVGLWAYLKGR